MKDDSWGFLLCSGSLRSHCPHFDQVEQVADVVGLSLGKQPLRARRRQVAEGWVVEAGGIHHTAAGELVEDFVDEADLGGALRGWADGRPGGQISGSRGPRPLCRRRGLDTFVSLV